MRIINEQITLHVNGEEITLSEEELIAILEEHFNKAKSEQQEPKPQQEPCRPIHGPEEGVPFEVNPNGINLSNFQEERKDPAQEKMRKTILKALDEVEKNPDKYSNTFWTLQPEKTWVSKTVGKLVELAKEKGDHNADWVEWAMELAQRITNGEAWEDVCNKPDTANWYRLIEWKNGHYRLVGGSRKLGDYNPASVVYYDCWCSNSRVSYTVPLVVLYNK